MGLRTVVYLRKSSKDQDENTGEYKQKNSLERQELEIKNYFEKFVDTETDEEKKLLWTRKLNVDFFQEDESAKVPGRPKFNEMLEHIKKHKFDVLLCYDLSRLSRNPIDSGQVTALLDKNPDPKIDDFFLQEIRTTDKVFTTSNTDRFTLSLFLAVAKFDNDQRGTNAKSGMKRKKSDGGTTNKAPIGYLNEDKKVVEHPENFAKCRELWDMALSDENYSLKDIYSRKEELGILHTFKGKITLIGDNAIRGMLSSKYYSGFIKNGKNEETGEAIWEKGSHPAMVDEDEFDKVQLFLQKSGHKHTKVKKDIDSTSLLDGVLMSGLYTFTTAEGHTRPANIVVEPAKKRFKCSKCSHSYGSQAEKPCPKCGTPAYKNKRISSATRISHLKNNGVNTQGKKVDSIALNIVENWINEELNTISISNRLFEHLKKRLHQLWLDDEKKYKAQKTRLSQKITEVEAEIGDLQRKKFRDDADTNAIEIALDNARDEKQSLKSEEEKLDEEFEESFEIAWQRLQVWRDAKVIFDEKGDFEHKKSLLLSLVSNIKLYKDRVEMIWRKPFDVLAKVSIEQNKKGGKNVPPDGKIPIGSGGGIRTPE